MPSGGMALWVRFRPPADVELWARRSVDRGVWWHTGRRYAFDRQPMPFARFSFACLNERELPEAVRRLAAARPRGIAQPSQVLTAKACPLSRRSASAGNRSKPAN